MRAKIIVLLSSGGAKFAPLLFGLFLMQWFGGGVYTSYVVLLNYAAALTALSCMGSTPQILRAGVTGNANMTVVRAALAAVIGMAILMLLSSAYWFAVAGTSFFTLLESGMWWDLRVVSFYCLGLLFVSLSHSILSQGERWLGLSVSYVTVYWLPLASGVMSGYYFNSGAVAIEMYCIIFFAVSLLSLILVKFVRGIEVYRYLKDVSFFSAVSDLLLGVKVSLFAVFLLIGFYVASYYVSLEFGELEGAVYSLSFQLFSISIFIPSVLGSIVIPMLSNKTKSDSAVDGSKVLFVYVGFSSFMAFTVFALSPLLLQLYQLDAGVTNVAVLLLMQVAALFASSCAYFVQQLVVVGQFGLLAVGGAGWLCMLICGMTFFNPGVVGVALVFITAYIVLNSFYYCSLRLSCPG